ncbi:S-methyl-5-thioribose-1-phosphate isomerase [Leptospira sp. GIMC2001]|uniref:S-methyl-5-thioribose-1-phosphate isomerase n=1 Tax=Leptospira sp. GIMC2001 TaxID=1513297 RepID=UPI002349E242|nr:S-methyl-5-thioribose-1-phosphate isomerase [Leptospira sp. GIMC2001]WCL48418.1 S-methyl-5-thioribose-1-phosphate isomerase [Leptospira sp. GIMC2001]
MPSSLKPILWENPTLRLLDQRLIPMQKSYIQTKDLADVITAIQEMAVRGAPAIAISGSFGLFMEFQKFTAAPPYSKIRAICERLQNSRPTAVNLSRMISDFLNEFTEQNVRNSDWKEILDGMEKFAQRQYDMDLKSNLQIGQNALSLFEGKNKKLNIITHCNTGALATAGHGTALGIIRSLRDAGFEVTVYADETRPYLQGSRLTAFEMMEEGIPCYIITDGMPAWLMNDRHIDAVIVGCDRIARNGDTANKIGTCGLAMIAREFKVPFYVAGTKDSFDQKSSDGSQIEIEMRNPMEVTQLNFLKNSQGENLIPAGIIAPASAKALNPSFDITPARFITKIITEIGIFDPGEQKID